MRQLLFILFITSISSLNLLAVDSAETVSYFDIEEISYNYELIQDKKGKFDCTGSLDLRVKVDKAVDYLIFCRTRHHLFELPQRWVTSNTFIDVDSEDNPTILISKETSWGIYFEIRACLSTGGWEYSPKYCINDYIQPEDWAKIQESAGIDDVVDETPIAVSFSNGLLSVDTNENLFLSVYDLTCRIVFSGNLSQPMNIPISANLIIVKYTTKDQTVTQKFIAK